MKSNYFEKNSMKSPSVLRHLRADPNATEEELMLKEEAAYFARCVLMPEEMVKKYWEVVEKRNRIKTMALMFNVPKDEMEFRLYELGFITNCRNILPEASVGFIL